MKKITLITIITSIILSCNSNNSEKDIEKVFNDFNMANINIDGNKIYELSDTESHQYYVNLLEKTIKYDSLKISNLNLIDKINVLSSRVVLGESLLNITSKEFMIKMYSEVNTMDEAKKNATRNMKIQNIKVSGDSATGELAPNGRSLNPKVFLKFNRENGKWKYNLTSMIEFTKTGLNKMLKENRMTHMDFINLVFSNPDTQNKFKKPLNESWKPLKK